MTTVEARELLGWIKKMKGYKYVRRELEPIETKVNHGMVLFKDKADKLEEIYRKCALMEDKPFSKVIV